jgi:HPt (histidine-containing phosphotransfer) domain-containing protein
MPYPGRLGQIRARLDDLAGPDPYEDEWALLARLLRSFTVKTGPAVDQLAAALRTGDAEDVRERAHGLKGSAANVGAGTLAALFAHLEHRARIAELARAGRRGGRRTRRAGPDRTAADGGRPGAGAAARGVISVRRGAGRRDARTSLQALFGCLELASPAAFARAGRIRSMVAALCTELELHELWEIEVAAMASQLGAVTVPPSVPQKLERGLPLDGDEQAMVDAMPDVAVRLLADVPMLHDVVEIVRGLAAPARSGQPPPLIGTAIDVVRTAIEFETLDGRGLPVESAIAVLECRENSRPRILAALRAVRGMAAEQDTVRALAVSELEVGMRIAEDIVAVNGLVLIGRGMVVTGVLLDRLANFRHTTRLVEPVLASVPT